MSGADVSVAGARRAAAARLAAAGVASADLDAKLFVEAASGLDAAGLAARPERAPGSAERARLEAMVGRRLRREPVAHILGRVGFWDLDLEAGPDALIPRPETEHVVEALLGAAAPERARVLDLGVGSGAILAALLRERPGWFGVGVDRSWAALALARRNLARCGLAGRWAPLLGDWNAALSGRFHVIACNPPYVRSGDIAGLAPEVAVYEPRAALDGGGDGLDAYRRIAPRLMGLLEEEGTAAFEIGAGQYDEVKELFTCAGLEVQAKHDLAGRKRVVVARRPRPRD